MSFDPFASGAATEVMDRPKDASPDAFDPFASGAASADHPALTADDPVGQVHPWAELFGGIDGMDKRLMPDQLAAFRRLDSISQNPKEARAAAIVNAYLPSQGIAPEVLKNNHQAAWDSYAQTNFGTPYKNISASTLYGLIGKRIQETNEAQESQGEVKPWTWRDTLGSDIYQVKKGITDFWGGLNKPIVEIPEAPKDLPNHPEMGIWNPALVGGVYNALKPLVEGAETPLGIGSLAAGGALKEASATYPLAKKALAGMTGIFTGLMGYGTVKAAMRAPEILKDPNASFEDKVTAVANPVADGAATLLGAVGTALEMFPEAQQPPILKELEGKNPAQAAQVLRREAQTTDIPGHSDFLNDAAHELDRIATKQDAAGLQEPERALVQPKTPPAEEKAATAKETSALGIKNADVDSELERMGLGKAEHGAPTSEAAELEKASAIMQERPSAGQVLVDELTQKPREISATEVAVLTREATRLRLERQAAEDEFIAADQNGDQADKMDARVKIARIQDQYQRALESFTQAGTKQAQAFRMRQMMLNEDYSLADMERRRVVANDGKPLSETQQSEVRELHRQLTEAKAKIDEYEAQRQRAAAEPIREAPKRRPPVGKARQFISDQAAKARERIKQRVTGERSSATLGLDVAADYAIVGAEYIANGVGKFTDWSRAMMNEFGEDIRPYLDDIFRRSIDARDDAARLQAYKSRTSTAIEAAKEKLESGEFSKEPRKPLPLDDEAKRLQAEYNQLKRKVQLRENEEAMKHRTAIEKTGDFAAKWARIGALSWPTVFAKLLGAAVVRPVTTFTEQIFGYGISQVLPELAKRAAMEGEPTFSGAVRAESKAFTAMWTKGMKGASDMLLNKETLESKLFEQENLPPEMVDYLGKMHGAMKYPTEINDFERRLQLNTEHAIRNGVDVTDPIQQLRLGSEAWKYAKRSIFLQDNAFVKRFQMNLKSLEQKSKLTGEPTLGGQALAALVKVELPIVKVPSNVIAETWEVMTGSLQGPVRAAFAYARGIEKIKPEYADMIIRLMKKGSIGSALMLLGYFNYKNIGGFYTPNDKRAKSDVPIGAMRTPAGDVPGSLLHNPYAQVVDYGATLHRVADTQFNKSDRSTKGLFDGAVAAGAGLLDEVPFTREEIEAGETFRKLQQGDVGGAFGEKAASFAVPGAIQWLAQQMDKKQPFNVMEGSTPRRAEGFKENLEKATPILRETLPKRNPRTSYR